MPGGERVHAATLDALYQARSRSGLIFANIGDDEEADGDGDFR